MTDHTTPSALGQNLVTAPQPLRRCAAIWNGCICGRAPHDDDRHVWLNTLYNKLAVDPAQYPDAARTPSQPDLREALCPVFEEPSPHHYEIACTACGQSGQVVVSIAPRAEENR